MRKKVLNVEMWVIFTVSVSVLFASCEPQASDTRISPYTCVVVNEGNFTESNGSISLYNRHTDIVQQEVYTLVNEIGRAHV